jgi:hypothetical protein
MSETKAMTVPPSSLFPSAEELKNLKDLAQTFISSGLIPRAIDKPEKAIVVMLKGKEAGVPPLQALAHIHVIDGKPSMSAELMLSQLYKNIPGFLHEFTETSNAACKMRVKRPGTEWQPFAFTMQDAMAAGLTGKGPWKAYPAAMLRARCISSMAKAIGPEALAGISYTPEELGAEIDGTGAVVSIPEAAQDKVARLRAAAKAEAVAIVPSEDEKVAAATEVASAAVESEPSWGDDLPITIQGVGLDPVGEYVLEANHTLMGKRLREVPADKLRALFSAAQAHAKSTGKGATGKALKDISRIEEWLRVSGA